MSQDIEDVWTCVSQVRASLLFWGWSWGSSGALVVAGGVEGEFAEDFAGGGVDDADVVVVGQEQDGGSGVGLADADVV